MGYNFLNFLNEQTDSFIIYLYFHQKLIYEFLYNTNKNTNTDGNIKLITIYDLFCAICQYNCVYATGSIYY